MQDKKARFRCGQLCTTPAALDKVGRAGLSIRIAVPSPQMADEVLPQDVCYDIPI